MRGPGRGCWLPRPVCRRAGAPHALAGTTPRVGLRAKTVTPRVSNSFASDSCFEPEKTSTSRPHLTPVKPVCLRTHLHSASSRAPAIQPDQRAMSSFASCGTGMWTTMSPTCIRPPGLSAR